MMHPVRSLTALFHRAAKTSGSSVFTAQETGMMAAEDYVKAVTAHLKNQGIENLRMVPTVETDGHIDITIHAPDLLTRVRVAGFFPDTPSRYSKIGLAHMPGKMSVRVAPFLTLEPSGDRAHSNITPKGKLVELVD